MTEQEQVQLLPCPFCGGAPQMSAGGPGLWYVRCEGCTASTDDGSRERAERLWNTRHMDEVTKIPSALLDQSCCIGLIGKNVVIDCETRAEAEEVLDWLCDARPALTAAIAKIEGQQP